MSVKRLASASLANLVVPVSGLLISPFLSRELGPDGRGFYAALTLPIVVYGWVGTYGLQDALSFHLKNGQFSRRAAARVNLVMSVPLGIVSIVLTAVVGYFIFAGRPDDYSQFLVLTLFAPLHVVTNLLIGALTGASDVRGVNLVKVVPAVLRTALVVVACLLLDLDAFWAGVLFMVTALPGVLLGFARLWRPEERVQDTYSASPVPTRSLLMYSLACLPGVLAAVSTARLPQVIGLPVIGATELGYYAVAVSVAEIPMVIATAARTLLLGRLSGATPRETTRIARLAVAVSVLGCGGLAAISGFAVPLVFGDAFTPSVAPTMILCVATVLYTIMVLTTAILLGNGKATWSSSALVVGTLASVLLIFGFASWGALGAAIASLGGYGVSVVVAVWGLYRSKSPYTIRMLTVPGKDDAQFIRRQLARVAGRRTAEPSVSSGHVS